MRGSQREVGDWGGLSTRGREVEGRRGRRTRESPWEKPWRRAGGACSGAPSGARSPRLAPGVPLVPLRQAQDLRLALPPATFRSPSGVERAPSVEMMPFLFTAPKLPVDCEVAFFCDGMKSSATGGGRRRAAFLNAVLWVFRGPFIRGFGNNFAPGYAPHEARMMRSDWSRTSRMACAGWWIRSSMVDIAARPISWQGWRMVVSGTGSRLA
jgi:hypothetical protein